MKLIEEKKNFKPNYFVITSEGRTELRVMRGLSAVFNGKEITILFPLSPLNRETGKKALNSIKTITQIYEINTFIYIGDGDIFETSYFDEIPDYLKTIGVNVKNKYLIEKALLLDCEWGSHKLRLMCIISGPETFIEEEIALLLNIKYKNCIDLSGKRNYDWKKRIKKQIKENLRNNKVTIEKLIKNTSKDKLQKAFPNYCAVMMWIEDKFR